MIRNPLFWFLIGMAILQLVITYRLLTLPTVNNWDMRETLKTYCTTESPMPESAI